MTTYRLLVTEGKWSNLIFDGIKTFDWRKGYRGISVGDRVIFIEADSKGNPTGRECNVTVTLVVHSTDFPPHFKWTGDVFTIIQFELNETVNRKEIKCPQCGAKNLHDMNFVDDEINAQGDLDLEPGERFCCGSCSAIVDAEGQLLQRGTGFGNY